VEQVPFDVARKSYADSGTPDWVITGSMQLFELINSGFAGLDHDDFATITGKPVTTVQQWVDSVKEGFRGA
jgi:hypothetical protein